MDEWARWLADKIGDHERRIKGVETQPQLAYSSIEDGALDENDANGNLVGVIGKQFDGTHTITSLNGPTPPTPDTPYAEAIPGLVQIRWNGKFFGGLVSPMDLKHIAAYVVPTGGVLDYTAQSGVMTGELGDVLQVQAMAGSYDVYLVAWTLSGRRSLPSSGVEVVVPELVDTEAIQADITAAEEAIADTRAEMVEADSVLTGKLADNTASLTAAQGRLDTAEQTLNVTFPAKFEEIGRAQTVAGKAVTYGSSPPTGVVPGKALWVTPSGHTYISQEC